MIRKATVIALAVSGAFALCAGPASASVSPINYWDIPPCPVNMHQGEGDNCVAYLQEKLNAVGGVQLSVDGGFGPNTENAVISFQRRVNAQYARFGSACSTSGLLSVDGVVGPNTKSDLDLWTSAGNGCSAM